MADSFDFRDMLMDPSIPFEQIPFEGIVFGDFDSRKEGWFLTAREAPTPGEQEVIENVPFRQGNFDFSEYNGDRFFKQREIKYTLMYFGENGNYADRKSIEQEIKRQLMPQTITELYDTHDTIYHWKGKVKSVEVEDDEKYGTLTATVVFDCYPFAIRNHDEFDDLWDEVYFPHWIFMDKRYEINGKTTVNYHNIGSRMVEVTLKVVSGSVSYGGMTINSGSSKFISVPKGKHDIEFDGNGVIELSAVREEMI